MTMFAAVVVKVFVIGEGHGEANRSCASCLRSCTVANILVNALALALGLSLRRLMSWIGWFVLSVSGGCSASGVPDFVL
jgi:hypothetical protein